ncbi:MAG: hypothetical protein E7571_05110 [Ruminococcaceae bacterium]|nr:hypothetical protein [Oscillospiraceae bacterium]
MSLHDELNNLERYPFHMPGHKRNKKFGIAGAEIDITEIDGFDNLHSPDGLLLDIENRLTSHYKSKKSFMLVNGSTVGILAAIFTVCDRGDTIIIARNCHKSVFNACFLLELNIAYLEPEFDCECGYYTNITQGEADRVTSLHPEAKAVVITSPTYEGIISEIHTSAVLIVDAAHGAHLGIKPFCAYPHGDIVISSLHKTLPALTQTAVANIYNEKLTDRYKKFIDILETSSPSYVLMNSVDICTCYLNSCGKDFKRYYVKLKELHGTGLKWLRIKHSDDLSKVVVSTAGAGISAPEAAEVFRNRYNIEMEAVGKEHLIFMTSVADSNDELLKLQMAIIGVDTECDKKSGNFRFAKPPQVDGLIKIAVDGGGSLTDINESEGLTAAEYVFAYPPDIPIIVPGEIITPEIIAYVTALLKEGVNVISDSGNLPKVLTK